MKKLSLIIATVLFSFGVVNTVVAKPGNDKKEVSHQVSITIDDLALLNIQSTGASNDITLNPTAPTTPGEGVSFEGVTDNTLWLNYSSIVANGKSRSISAKLSGALPGGTSLLVAAASPASDGKGSKGTAVTSSQELSTTDSKNIVTGIGSCYTGVGASKGVNLSYTLKMEEDDYDELYEYNSSVTVTYTISDLQ